MSPSQFEKYTNSSEFKALLTKYENAMASEELVYFDSDDIIDIAEYYHITGDLENAENAATYCSQLYPELTTPILFKARLALLDYNDTERAKQLLEQIPEDDDTLEYIYVKAEIMIIEGKFTEANRYLTSKYLELQRKSTGKNGEDDEDDSDEEDRGNGGELQEFIIDVATMYDERGLQNYAILWLLKIYHPDEAIKQEYYELWTRIYLANERWAEAEKTAEKLIDIDAFNATAWLMISDAQFHASHYNDALQSAEYAEAIAPNTPETLIAKGNCLFTLNRLDEARTCFERYLGICPEEPIGELLLASVLYSQNDTAEAYRHVLILLQKTDNLSKAQAVEALRTSASIAARAGDMALALECCDRLEDYGKEQKIDADIARGAVYVERRDMKQATIYLNRAAQAVDYDPDALERIGVIYYQAGLYNTAYDIFKEAITPYETGDKQPCPDVALAYLTAVCHELGKRKEYLHYLAMAVDIVPLDISRLIGDIFPPGTEPKDYLKIESDKDKDNPTANENNNDKTLC